VVLLAILVPAGVLSACGRSGGTVSAPSISPECRSAPSATVAEATTASYQMALALGPVEPMLTEAPASTAHPMHGEVMLRGQMVTLPGTTEDRHLEVHICSKTTGKVVQDAQPVITVIDDATGGTSQNVPVAVMQGAGQGVHDLHYGNNVVMQPGHAFTVLVAIGPEQATFKVMTPSSSPGPSTTSPGSPAPGGVTPGMSQGMSHG
jgi:hypothetical protein